MIHVMQTYIKEDDIGGVKDYRTYTHVSGLHNWEENPREIKTELFDFLVTSLAEEGQLMPMLVDVRPEKMGTILGGNMTFTAWTERLNNTEVWIKPVLPRDDAHADSLALKHNANYGTYIENKLLAIAKRLQEAGYALNEIPIPPAPEISLQVLLDQIALPESKKQNKEIDPNELAKELNLTCPKCGFQFKGDEGLSNEQLTPLSYPLET